MDELLRDFLVETSEHIEGAENQLVQFERDPSDASLIASIFRLVHTIKGTSSFLGLNRLQDVAHGAETLISELRDGAPPTERTVTLILAAIDRIKKLIEEIEEHGGEPEGDDGDLVAMIAEHAQRGVREPEASASAVTDEPAKLEDEQPDQPAATAAPKEAPENRSEDSAGKASASSNGAAKKTESHHTQETIRVTVDTIERIMQLVSELVLTRNQLLELTRNREEDTVKAPLQRLSTVTSDLQDAVMRARMQPVGRLYSSLPRLIRELSSELGKKIDLVTEGADTELDRQLIDVIRDPMTHLIRNCADHGIERPDERVAVGKPEVGTIRVSASHEAGHITIDIVDDGRGLNLEKIKSKILSSGLATTAELAAMTDQEIYQQIFEPGFSTASNVTNVSGRGVGMDVVKSNIESIGGSVTLSSNPGAGCRFSLRIPLTLAIAPALIVEVGDQRFALPQHAVVEAVGVGGQSPHKIEKLQNSLVLKLRERVIPVVALRSVLALPEDDSDRDNLVVIMRVGQQTIGVIVDDVADVQEIVVKPLSATIAHLSIFTGHTILGDGSVVLIIDPAGVAVALGIEKSAERKSETVRESSANSDSSRYVLFRAGAGAPKVLPLSLVGRIESIEASRIEEANGQFVVQHRGRLMPLVLASPAVDIYSRAVSPALIISIGTRTLGLLVDEIIDIFEGKLDIQMDNPSADIIGTTVVQGQAVELVDMAYHLRSAFPEPDRRAHTRGTRLLMASRDKYATDVLCPTLMAAGFEVNVCGDTSHAKILIQETNLSFDMILVDLEEPALNLREIEEACRSSGYDDVPIIGLDGEVSANMNNFGVRLATRLGKFDRNAILGAVSMMIEANLDEMPMALAS